MVAKRLKVDGVPEAQRAFDKVASEIRDLSDVHRAEVEMLLPDVRSASRRASGDLVAGWQADGIAKEGHFVNEVPYAGVQEWGWLAHNIEPTHAIMQAVERNDKQTEALYGDAIAGIAGKAGFDTKKS